MEYIHHYHSPLGGITVASDGEVLTGLWFDGQKYFAVTLAKEHEEKDAIALFTPEENHVYQWDAFREQVQNGKLKALQTFFLEYPERGNAFLHHMMELLRPVEDGGNRPIELARYAYLLSKLQPSWHSSQYPTYREFIEQAYGWALSGEDRRQLISASYLYLYENRKGKTDGVTQ